MSIKTMLGAIAASTAIGSALGAAFALVAAPAYPGAAHRSPAPGKAAMAPASTTILCFTPEGQCEDLIVREIGNAEHQILVHAYSFTAATAIPGALLDAQKRGVQVRIIMDRTTPCDPPHGHSAIALLVGTGIDLNVDPSPPIAHIKAMIIDGAAVLSGSYNWTKQARYNSEELRLDRDTELAAQFSQHWQRRMAVSVPYSAVTDAHWCHHQQAEAP